MNAIFAVLVILGIVADPTPHGIADSERALHYEEIWSDVEEKKAE